MRLGPRGQAISALVFDLLSFGYIALTGWYFLLFVMSSYRREAMASTALGTPLWIPETAMVVGAVMLLIVLGKAVVHDVRKIVWWTGFEVLVVLVIFIGLLGVGMTVPFAILLPGMVYLLERRHRRTARHGPDELGQHGQLRSPRFRCSC